MGAELTVRDVLNLVAEHVAATRNQSPREAKATVHAMPWIEFVAVLTGKH